MGLLFCKIRFNLIISIFLFYIVVIWNIYNFIKPFRQFPSCTALLCIAQTRRNCTGANSRAARESGRTFMWGLPPPHPLYGCHTHFGLTTDRKTRSFSSEADPCPASLRERCLPSVSATWSMTILKECVIL